MALSNQDFRQLLNAADASVLATTREQKKKPQQQQQRPPGHVSAAQQRRRERYIEILKRKQQKNQKDAEGTSGGGGYRDRADERRKQKQAFYAHVAEELAEIKERSVEESKFLGGDIEHTHLVKGLDLALLAKVRGELSKEQQRKPKTEEAPQDKLRGKAALQIHNPRLRRAFHLLLDTLHPHAARFRDKLSNYEMRIMTGLSLPASSARDSFGNGCLSYSFLVGPGASSGGFLPTFLRRSALLQEADGTSSQREKAKASAAPIQTKLLKELTEALAWHRENRKKKKEERLPRRPTGRQAASGGRDEGGEAQADADIFSGVGRFDASAVLAEVAAEAAGGKVREGDAKTADWIREEGEMELDDEQPLSTSANDAPYDRGQLLTRGGADSEDEDGDSSMQIMDTGEYRDVINPKRSHKKALHQFPSQAAYEEYMSSIEFVPKGAYSYGRRLAGEDFNPGKNKKKPKLNPDQEWKAIEKIIAEKHKK
ncbi:protein Red [Cyclospora cayetanensis]|uniref:Protein Red n=1 Tax=Cyclospora cayetanensis TaxID=88456 RepID=A0A6P6S3F8_9EIME|nr:protein Red [Cyclospora cayetanensis]